MISKTAVRSILGLIGASIVFSGVSIAHAAGSASTVQISYRVTSDWGSGFCGEITVLNATSSKIDGWSGSFEMPNGTVNQLWNANWSQAGSKVILSSMAWNQSIAGNDSIHSPGFCANRSAAASSASSASAASSSRASSASSVSSAASSSRSSIASSSSKSSLSSSSVASSSVASSSRSSAQSSSVSSASSSAASSSASTASCGAYTWPKYTPDLNYDMKTDPSNATVNPANFKVYLGCNASLVAGYKTSGRFAFIWGKNYR